MWQKNLKSSKCCQFLSITNTCCWCLMQGEVIHFFENIILSLSNQLTSKDIEEVFFSLMSSSSIAHQLLVPLVTFSLLNRFRIKIVTNAGCWRLMMDTLGFIFSSQKGASTNVSTIYWYLSRFIPSPYIRQSPPLPFVLLCQGKVWNVISHPLAFSLNHWWTTCEEKQNGEVGNRTPDLVHAKHALCQLSYIPLIMLDVV